MFYLFWIHDKMLRIFFCKDLSHGNKKCQTRAIHLISTRRLISSFWEDKIEMNLENVNFPRQLEAAGLAEKIRLALAARKTRLWPEGKMEVPLLSINESLAGAIRNARLQRRIRFGFDDIF